jgi:hypothetical protein
MKRRICLCVFALVSACQVMSETDSGEDLEPTAGDEIEEGDGVPRGTYPSEPDEVQPSAEGALREPTPEDDAFLAALATGDLGEIQNAAILASAAGCHGDTVCTGVPITEDFQFIECGPTFCGSTFCGPKCPRSDPFCDRPIHIRQRTEKFRVWRVDEDTTCVEYHPAFSSVVGCGC